MYIDRLLTLFLNGSQSLYIDGLIWTATQTSTWLPLAVVLLYVVIKNNDIMGVVRIVVGIALSILIADQVASSIFKPMVARWRPTNDPSIMYLVDVVKGYRGGSYGFFSSHAANTMAVATFLTFTIRNKCLSLWLLSWNLLNCWTRVYLGVHYVGDLIVGCIWGIIVGWSMYRMIIHNKIKRQTLLSNESVSSNAALVKYSERSIHIFVFSLWLTYVYIMFKAVFFVG